MPHCTSNFAWYLGKFVAGFTGMLFFYMVFLKEEEYSCLCRARMRDFIRSRGENTNPCILDDQADANVRKEGNPRFILVAAGNLRTWYAGIKEWFRENDPAISENAPALRKGLPKNDNDISSVSCACHVTLLNRKSKFTESTTNLGRKKLGQHCLFRHCSGIVCADKLLKKRKKHSCVRTRFSQDTVNKFWKFCIANANDDMQDHINNIGDPKFHVEATNVRSKDTKIGDTHEENIQNIDGCRSNELSTNGRSVETKTDILQENAKCTDEADDKQNILTNSLCNFVNVNETQSSAQDIEIPCKEQRYSDSETKQVPTEKAASSQIKNKISEGNTKSGPTISDEERIENIDLNKYDYSRKTSRKESQSETSFTETIMTDNCMDSILYLELRRNRAPKNQKKTSIDRLKFGKHTESKLCLKSKNIKSLQESNAEKIPEERDKYNLQHTAIKQFSSPINQKKQFDCLSRNCPCDTKKCSRPLWNNYKRASSTKLNHETPQRRCKILYKSLQPRKNNFLTNNLKSKKIIDSMFNQKSTVTDENRFIRPETSFLQDKKIPFANIGKDKSRRSRALEDEKFEDSTDNSSAISSELTESSDHGNQIGFQCPSYKSTMNNRHNYGHSSPSSLSSWKRCPSCTVLFEQPVRYKRETISSSSCTSIHKRRRKARRRWTSSSSTSSASLISSLTFRQGCNFNESNINQNTRALFRINNRMFDEEATSIREPRNRSHKVLLRLYEQGKNRTTYANERHVTWGFKHAY